MWATLCILACVAMAGCGKSGSENQAAARGKFTPKVYIENQDGHFRVIRDGQPWYIRGAAGDGEYMETLADAGGNTLRLYWWENAEDVLKKAQTLGLAVIVDLPVPQVRSGFDYGDRQKVDSLTRHLVEVVNRLDTFPSLLMWCAGNEFDLQRTDAFSAWQKLNQIIEAIHAADPNHPVITATQAGSSLRYAKIMGLVPELDALGINLFKEVSTIRADWEAIPAVEKKPYLLTEWAPLGTWQANQTTWEAPVEPNSQQKAAMYQLVFEKSILADTVNCLGSCVFYWGQKQERTHTWYSLFTETGDKTSIVDVMTSLWKGPEPANRAPDMQALTIRGFKTDSVVYLHAGREYVAWMYYQDLDGDTVSRSWEIVPEGSYRQRFGGEKELRPHARNDLFLEAGGDWFHFRAPSTAGPFRLFAYARDQKGGAASANLPFFVVFPEPSAAK